jgi:hypothetical protein
LRNSAACTTKNSRSKRRSTRRKRSTITSATKNFFTRRKRFRQKISELHLLQDKQYKELKVEHDLQKKEKDQDRKNLEAQIT